MQMCLVFTIYLLIDEEEELNYLFAHQLNLEVRVEYKRLDIDSNVCNVWGFAKENSKEANALCMIFTILLTL